MSSTKRIKREDALPIANTLIEMLAPACVWIEVAGSLRRGRPDVGDIELVALPSGDPASLDNPLLRLLNRLVDERTITKATYGEKRMTRWGQKLRGFLYDGVLVELSLVDLWNRGRIFWLRTGPDNDREGRANTYLQTAIKRRSGLDSRDGYLWHKDQKLYVPDESAYFRLLGMPWIPPEERTIDTYKQALAGVNHRWGDPAKFVPHILQVGTAQMGVPHEDALNITVKSADSDAGRFLAPTWDMVMGHKESRLTDAEYVDRYLGLLRLRWLRNPQPLRKLLQRDSVVLKCYCAEGAFCHRHIAVEVLARIAMDERDPYGRYIAVERLGEVQREAKQQSMF
jgi:hypothetical protein